MDATTEDATRDMWARWIVGYTPAAFFDAFMRTAQGARARCVNCGETVTLDIREGGGVADWGNDGDYGCWASPDTGEDGTGGHVAEGTEDDR